MNKTALLAYFVAANTALALPEDTGSQATNIICAANASRFVETHQSVPLTNYAIGWKDASNIDGQLEFLAPECTVPDRFNYREFSAIEDFLADMDDKDVRAIGADFAKVEYTGSEKHDKVGNKGLTVVVETRELSANPGKRNQIVDRLMRRLKRNELIRAHRLHVASSITTNITFAVTDEEQPDARLREEIILSADGSGMRPNRVFIGETAWDKRMSAYEKGATAGHFAGAARDKARLAQYLNASVEIGESRYQESATVKTQIGGNAILLFYADSGLSADDPSTIKRFVAPCDDGSKVRVFEQQLGPKLTAITVEHYSSIRITSTLGKRALIIG